jgi:hypothetical protein
VHLLAGVILALNQRHTVAATPFMIDQSGENAAGFPYADISSWGVKQVTGGSPTYLSVIECEHCCHISSCMFL